MRPLLKQVLLTAERASRPTAGDQLKPSVAAFASILAGNGTCSCGGTS